MCPEKTRSAINRLDELLKRTLLAPCIKNPEKKFILFYEDIKISPFLLSPIENNIEIKSSPSRPKQKPLLKKAKSDSNLIHSITTKKNKIKPLNFEKIRNKMSSREEILMSKKIAMRLSIYDHQWGNNWIEKLLNGLKTLKEPKVICALGEQLSALQALEITNHLINQSAEEWKLLYILGSLRHDVFAEILSSFSGYQLKKINMTLRHNIENNEERARWFELNFKTHQNGFVKSCNRLKDEIDTLASRFREDLDGHLLTSQDLKPIEQYIDHIKLRIQLITNYLMPLIENVIEHPETKHVLSEGIIKEYKTQLIRLTETKNYENRPAGCLYPIIFRNVFERAQLEDDDAAYEALAEWVIIDKQQYWEVGLFGEMDKKTFEKIKKMNLFEIATKNLEKINIKTIADWKREKIFNAKMLKEFLSKTNICTLFTKWTKEAIEKESF